MRREIASDAPASERSPLAERGLWRLQGLGASDRSTFLLRRRESLVGSAEACHLMVRMRGVSRRHASLTAHPGAVVVHDLGSRNGTFCNGQRIEETRAESGDEIRFGPARFRLERVDRGDLELALISDASTITQAEDTEWQPRLESAGTARLHRELVLLLLGPAMPDLVTSLELLTQHAGALGAALGEWPGHGEPNLFSTAGDIGTNMEHPALYEFFGRLWKRAERAPCFQSGTVATSPALDCAGFARPGAQLLALVLRGGDLSDEWRDTAEIFLRLIDRARDRRQDRERIGSDFGTLAIPLAFVRGQSPAMQLVYRQLEQLQHSDIPVLFEGETGVGKEHLVRLVHDASGRRSGPFVAVNCAAIPPELLEAEMFGIGKGVATGVQERIGRFREAHLGTLFLDEIGDMPLALQAKLLRALEAKTVVPVGGGPVAADVRIVCATNVDLQQRIAGGRFRADLFYRVQGVQIRVPPLRERLHDLPNLVQHFLGRFSIEVKRPVSGVTVSAMRALSVYAWPGNVRELENEVRRLVLACRPGQPIEASLLSPQVRNAKPRAAGDSADGLGLRDQVAAFEERVIRATLERTHGSRRKAALILGISRNGLASKMQRYRLDGSFAEPVHDKA